MPRARSASPRDRAWQVQDVNKLLKQHADMLKMMKRVNKLGEKGFMRSLGGMSPPPGFPR